MIHLIGILKPRCRQKRAFSTPICHFLIENSNFEVFPQPSFWFLNQGYDRLSGRIEKLNRGRGMNKKVGFHIARYSSQEVLILYRRACLTSYSNYAIYSSHRQGFWVHLPRYQPLGHNKNIL